MDAIFSYDVRSAQGPAEGLDQLFLPANCRLPACNFISWREHVQFSEASSDFLPQSQCTTLSFLLQSLFPHILMLGHFSEMSGNDREATSEFKNTKSPRSKLLLTE